MGDCGGENSSDLASREIGWRGKLSERNLQRRLEKVDRRARERRRRRRKRHKSGKRAVKISAEDDQRDA